MEDLGTLPDYLNVEKWERGGSFSVPFETYRYLCRTASAVIHEIPNTTMAIYKLQDHPGCGLDIFSAQRYLCLEIDSENSQLSLFSCHLDSVSVPVPCILQTDLSPSGWQTLSKLARKRILSDA
jgi:hypothetical protein